MQEEIRAMCYHLRLKLPENIPELQLGSHTNLQNYSGEKQRKSRAEQTTFSHDFKALSITAEFCSSQLLLELSPILTELVRKEKNTSFKNNKPLQPELVESRQSEKEAQNM